MAADDKIRIIKYASRLLGENVLTRLLDRGWVVADLDVSDEEPLEWIWPPTAPVAHGEVSEPGDDAWQRLLRRINRPVQTPWIRPTRITRAASSWRVEYGSAIAQEPDPPLDHASDAELLADLERIECWPMPVNEARQIHMERVNTTTRADAHDAHSMAAFLTEPYSLRLTELHAHIRADDAHRLGLPKKGQPSAPRPRGDLHARVRLVNADAWVSAVRTARVGGKGWGLSGPEG